MIMFMITPYLLAQEVRDQALEASDSDFLLFLDFAYDENQKSVEQTGYSDTDQKTTKNIYNGGVGYVPFFFLGGLHRERSIDTSYGSGETKYSDKIDGYGLWGLLFFGLGEVKISEDYQVLYSNENLLKEESDISISARAGFIPILLDNPLFLAYSESDVNFVYHLTIGDGYRVSENIDFKVKMLHLFRILQTFEGPSIGGMFNKIISFETLDNRDGEIDGSQYGLDLGLTLKSGFSVRVGGARQDTKIKIDSETNEGTLTKISKEETNRIGIHIPLSDTVKIILERSNYKKYSLNRDSFDYFENKKEAFEQTTSFGVILNENLRLDLSFGSYQTKHRDENNVYVDLEPVNRYSLSDKTVGIKIRYRFSNKNRVGLFN